MLKKLATAGAYAQFIAGSLFLGTAVSLVLYICVRNQKKRCLYFRKTVRSFCRYFVRYCRLAGVFKTSVAKEKELNELRGSVVIANHPSLVDYVILISCMNPNTTTIFKQSLKKGFMKFVLRGLDYIGNDSDIEDINKHLEDNANLLIFPEGSRTKTLPLKFSRGAAQIAIRNKMPVYKIFIRCDTPGYLQHRFFSDSMTDSTPQFYIVPLGTENITDELYSNAAGISARRLTKKLETDYNEKLNEI
jgi:1-acyl-sn-glycerol-3-phosphate acyltransferase